MDTLARFRCDVFRARQDDQGDQRDLHIAQDTVRELRDRVLAAVDTGEAVRAVAPRFGVSVSYVYKAVIRRRRSGEVAARTIRGRPPRKLAAHERAVEAFMRARQDATLADLCRHLLEAHGINVSLGAA